jgi:carbon storage regulator
MLVLTRKPGQSFRIGDDIEIVIVEVRGEQVRVGVVAPRSMPVVRMDQTEERDPQEDG